MATLLKLFLKIYILVRKQTSTHKFPAHILGASMFGISNLTLLAQNTHKFESKYLETLVGDPLSQLDLFEDRSPIYHVQNVSTPVIFLHGTEDAVSGDWLSFFFRGDLLALKTKTQYG